MRTRHIFSFAGLFDVWTDAQGKKIKTFTIITTNANPLVLPIHDRMPVILEKKHEDEWLMSNNMKRLTGLLKPYELEKNMEVYPVNPRVNNPATNTKENIKPYKYA